METALQEVTNTIHRPSTPRGINQFRILRNKKMCAIHTIHWTQMPPKCNGQINIGCTHFARLFRERAIPAFDFFDGLQYQFALFGIGNKGKVSGLNLWIERPYQIIEIKKNIFFGPLGNFFLQVYVGGGLCDYFNSLR